LAKVKWLAACVVAFGALSIAPAVLAAREVPAVQAPGIERPAGLLSAPPDTTPGTTPNEVSDSVPTGSTVAGVVPPGAVAVGAAPLVVIPSGCAAPRPAAVVFVGLLVANDSRTARFRLEQVRAGSADGYAVTDLIDVRFDDDVRFLTPNEQYLVGAAPLDGSAVLASKVRDAKPLFGGNAVVGVNDKTLECPTVDDPIRTLHVDGSEIDSGIFNGLKGAKRDLLLSVVTPVIWAFAIILALVLFRWLVMAMLVVMRRAANGEQVTAMRRTRRHHSTR
jgi:hypothetical protein